MGIFISGTMTHSSKTLLIIFLMLVTLTSGQNNPVSSTDSLQKRINKLEKDLQDLKSQYEKQQPRRPYIIINTTENKFTIRDGAYKRHGKCSTGSYILLKATDSQEWLFKTPRGEFVVTVKLRNPTWYKPDWAFVEEGLDIPPLTSIKRYQDGVLGDYALAFGQGYLVHGTLYKRLLGMPVTHGCVRLDDDDMQIAFNRLTHGSKVFIF